MVPKYDDEKLSASSLILADKMEQVPTKQIGTGQFILGNTYVRPRVSSGPLVAVSFHRSQKLNFWMQVYNLAIDDKSKQNAATDPIRRRFTKLVFVLDPLAARPLASARITSLNRCPRNNHCGTRLPAPPPA